MLVVSRFAIVMLNALLRLSAGVEALLDIQETGHPAILVSHQRNHVSCHKILFFSDPVRLDITTALMMWTAWRGTSLSFVILAHSVLRSATTTRPATLRSMGPSSASVTKATLEMVTFVSVISSLVHNMQL